MRYVPVVAKTTIGNGSNRLEIYQIHGETSERQALIFWPQSRLLYGSGPAQDLDGNPQTVGELAEAVRREGLIPSRFYVMHMMPTAWEKLIVTLRQPALFPDASALR